MRRGALILLFVAAAAGSGCDDGDSGRPITIAHDTLTATTLITTESELIGNVTAMTVGADGRLFVADYALKHVLSLTRDGKDPVVIGRKGSGPGEFEAPIAVSADDSVRVFDMQHGTVQVFSREGAYVRQFHPGAPGFGRGTFARDGGFAFATNGMDSVLVKLVDSQGGLQLSLGEPVVPPSNMWDFGAIKTTIRERRVPDEFRNGATPVVLDDGAIVVAFSADPEVRKYDAEGGLAWSTRLSDPVLDARFEYFVRRNTENPNPAQLFNLNYFADVAAAGDEIWLLLSPVDGQPVVILVLDAATGQVQRRSVLQGVGSPGSLAIDPARRRLYLASSEDASIAVVTLP